MAADILDILTLAEGKQAVGLGNTDSSQDAQLEYYITAASGILDDYIGPVVNRDIIEFQNGSTRSGARKTSIVLNFRPVYSVTEVLEYETGATTAITLTEDDPTTHPAEGFYPELYSGSALGITNGILHRKRSGMTGYWAAGVGNISVDYTAGRFTDTASVTRKYKRACAIILENLWRDTQAGVMQLDEYTVPHQSFPTFAMPNAVKEMFPSEIGQQEGWGFA
jgi:hypothetical protein